MSVVNLSYSTPLDKFIITKLSVTYHKVITQNSLCILNSRFIYLELVTVSTNHTFRIVVPLSLCRIVFHLTCPSPVADHV